jgi:hypothetical protein
MEKRGRGKQRKKKKEKNKKGKKKKNGGRPERRVRDGASCCGADDGDARVRERHRGGGPDDGQVHPAPSTAQRARDDHVE